MTFQELKTAYLHLDYEDFTNKILINLQDGLKNTAVSELQTREDHEDYLQLLNSFRSSIAANDRLHGKNFIKQLTSMLSTGEDGVYDNSLRYIFELIQNVDDCDYQDPLNASLQIKFSENSGRIILKYNETGFTPLNIFAFTGIAEAAKNIQAGKVQIGEKGIGFKSVFGVAHRVWIQSGKFSFALDRDAFCVPIPIYDERYEEIDGTKLTLFADPAVIRDTYQKIARMYGRPNAVLQNNPILFLNKLTKLRFFTDEFDSLEFYVSQRESLEKKEAHDLHDLHFEKEVVVSADIVSRKGYNLNNSIRCVRYTMPIKFNRQQCVSRYGEETEFEERFLNMQLLFPDPEDLPKLNKQGAFYSYLPTGMRLSVPLVCHVPFKLDASREHIDPQGENKWFVHCCSSLSDFLNRAYQHYSTRYGSSIAYYVPARNEPFFVQNNEKAHALNRQDLSGQSFVHQKIFPSLQGNFKSAGELCFFETEMPVAKPLLAARLLNSPLEVFQYPLGESKDFGMKKIVRVRDMLFSQAFNLNASTEEIFCYLEDHLMMKDNAWQTLVSTLSDAVISVPQVCTLFQHTNCMAAFQRKSTNQKNQIFPAGLRVQFNPSDTANILHIDPSGEEFELESFPSSLQEYLNRIQFRCIILNLETTDFLIADNVLILSGDVLEALSDLCSHAQKQSFFGLQLKYRQVSRTLNDVNNELPDIEFLSLLRGLRESQRVALGKEQYQNYIDLLKNASTNSNDRFLNELLQNADDCLYSDQVIPTFSLDIKGTSVTTQYNEQGFTKSNVRAITAIGESTKKKLAGECTIGEKGVGFKSVFSIASEVEIHSGDFHFLLTKGHPTVPNIIHGRDSSDTGTTMILHLEKELPAQLLMPSNILHLCLCLRKLKDIRIGKTHIRIEDEPNQRLIFLNDIKYVYRMVRYQFCVTDENLLLERANHQRIIDREQNIVFYLPTKDTEGCIYSGLPTTVKLNIPLYIDAPFELTTSRDDILTSKWNTLIWQQLFLGYRKLLETIAPDLKIRTLQYLGLEWTSNRFAETTSFKLFERNEYNQKLPEPVLFFSSSKIIPTLSSVHPLVSAKDIVVLYPLEAYDLISKSAFLKRPLHQIIDTSRTVKYDSKLKALGCKEAPVEEIASFLLSHAAFQMDDDFAIKFWHYLYEQRAFLSKSFLSLVRNSAVTPVLGDIPGEIQYVRFDEKNIYTDPTAEISPAQYYVLSEKIISRRDIEEIFKVFQISVNQMDERYRESLFCENLEKHLQFDSPSALYTYLLKEYRSNNDFKKWGEKVLCQDKNKGLIPLKNELGEIRIGQIYLCNEAENYFAGSIVPSCRCSGECSRFAQFVRTKELCDVYFDDLKITARLTEDDIESLQDDYFKHGANILESCVEHQLISNDLMERYHLGALQKQEYFIEPDEFPNEPIRNLNALQNSINNAPLQRIIKEERTRTVDCIQQENGTTELFDKNYARREILRRYTPPGKPYCICQMCLTGKPDNLMEVNNLQSKPKFYWPEMRLVLCLECSKKFEALRSGTIWSQKFERAILATNGSIPGPVKVPIGNDTITFTQTHLVQIQMILKKKLL